MTEGLNTYTPQPTETKGNLTGKIISFSGFLKNHGFRVFPSSLMEALQGLEQIDISNRGDFYAVLRANLVTTSEEWDLFESLFAEFWAGMEDSKEEEESDQLKGAPEGGKGETDPESKLDVMNSQKEAGEDGPKEEETTGALYSPVASLVRKDIARFDSGDVQVARLIMKNLISPFRISKTHRFKRSRRPANVDFRKILKKSLKTSGIPIELFYKKKRKRLKKLVILTDVSGSMDRYARFVMPFIMGLKGIGSKAEVFVFSTSLTPITSILKRFTVDEALEIISSEVPDWSGGTRIGHSLHQFNERYGERLLGRRTVVVIMSDGWDLGGRDLLKREMEILNQKANAVIWLNPLAGDSDYEPVCQGMQAAMPYVDHFLAADSLRSLKKVGRLLSSVMHH